MHTLFLTVRLPPSDPTRSSTTTLTSTPTPTPTPTPDCYRARCDHKCSLVHGSPVCSCRYGYILCSDGRTCKDKDECQVMNGGCYHICVNTPGGYHCSCNSGYWLDRDGHSCHSYFPIPLPYPLHRPLNHGPGNNPHYG